MYNLQNILNMLVTEIKEKYFILGREPEQVYTQCLKVVLHATEQARFPEVETNVLLTKLVDEVKALIIGVNSLLRQRMSRSNLYFENTLDALERMKNSSKPSYIVLCDALSLTEYIFLLHSFHRFIEVDNAMCAINPSGKTATFKYLANEYLNIKMPPFLDELTMKNVGKSLKDSLKASGFFVFRDIDTFIHYGGEYGNFDDMAKSLFKIANKLCVEVENLLNDKYRVLILSDHGYDVQRQGNVWTLTHAWEKERPCVSPFVLILIIG